jgi:hypothetical protein
LKKKSCPPNYYGTRCENYNNPIQHQTTPFYLNDDTVYSRFTPTSSIKQTDNQQQQHQHQQKMATVQPRCNFTVSVENMGAYAVRFKIEYTIDGIRQPIYTSPSMLFIGNTESVVIPHYSKNIKITMQKFTLSWSNMFQDANISTDNSCIKCYKTWGTFFSPKWDHLRC